MSATSALSSTTWAATHGVELSAEKVDTDEYGYERWLIQAKTPGGTLGCELENDGSYAPDPFDILFGVWKFEHPEHEEFAAAVNVLGVDAVIELVKIVGWAE